jgi:uncharacterized delta-60 repeat protein
VIVIVSGRRTTAFTFGQLLVVRLDADGSLDPTFGTRGIVTAPIAPTCGACQTAALAPDGDIVLTGEAGQLSAALGGDPSAPSAWEVASLTPAGALDSSFGDGGLETIPATDAGGYDVAVLASGEVMTLGLTNLSGEAAGSIAELSLLGPNGGPDRGFDAGQPAALPAGSGATALLVEPDGAAIVGGASALFGFTPDGRPDPAFGQAGVAQVGRLPSPLQLLPASGGGLLAVGRLPGAAGTLTALRVTAAGAVDPTLGGQTGIRVKPAFGGGRSSSPPSADPGPAPPLAQDSFAAHALVARPDGSLLAVGGVDVLAPTGTGRGRLVSDFAAAALAPDLTPLRGFGGPAGPLRLHLSVPPQTASAAEARHAISVRLDVSARGLANVTVRAAGHLIADGLLAIPAAGPRILSVGLTAEGRRLLSGRAGVPVTARATARNLVTTLGRTSAAGLLA